MHTKLRLSSQDWLICMAACTSLHEINMIGGEKHWIEMSLNKQSGLKKSAYTSVHKACPAVSEVFEHYKQTKPAVNNW